MNICPKHNWNMGTYCAACRDEALEVYRNACIGGYRICNRHGPYSEPTCQKCQSELNKNMSAIVKSIAKQENAMNAPTEAQLKDPAWWTLNAPSGCEKIGVAYIDGKVWSHEFMMPGVTAMTSPCNADVRFFSRPTKKAEPDRTAPEWDDWKIPPGSWPHWMLERMHRETGRMSYDNPVKGMIRDLWSTVDGSQKASKPAAPEWDGEGLPPVGCECEAYVRITGHSEEWVEVEVLKVCEEKQSAAVMLPMMSLQWASEFRPIRTKEQRDREEVIEAAIKACPSPGSLATRVDIEALYDAGMLRKVS
ncbi:hypothetical protein [Marinobacter sp. MC3]|uniref:hypothetical protein n=3 Tax=unclassified Marinobacter TaxID=83889 RepID=UPI001925215C|nr:hypothetical protein [Marinobacter sp. MC3]MBL3893656.1 hypothetical protein [Marinobacter sp. MW3]